MTELTFDIVYNAKSGAHWGTITIRGGSLRAATEAVTRSKRYDADFTVEVEPTRPVKRSDFTTYERCCDLALLGYFFVDQPCHRSMRRYQAGVSEYIAEAYETSGLDQDAEYRGIAAEVDPQPPAGIWMHSWGPYGAACAKRDREVLSYHPAIAQSIIDLAAECGQPTTGVAL